MLEKLAERASRGRDCQEVGQTATRRLETNNTTTSSSDDPGLFRLSVLISLETSPRSLP